MRMAEAIVWVVEARERREKARAVWNESGAEIKRIEAMLKAAVEKNAALRDEYHAAWGVAQEAIAAYNKVKNKKEAA